MRNVFSMLVIACLLFAVAEAGAQSDKAAQSKMLKEQADLHMKSGNRAVAIITYKQAIGLNPNNWEAHDALGTAYFKEKMYLDAAMEFTEAIALNPGYAAGYYNIAYAYRKATRYNEAIKYYEKYVKVKPDDNDAFFGLAESYKAVGEKDRAIDNYKIYIAKETRPSEQKWIDKARAAIAELQGGAQPAAPSMLVAPVQAAPSPPPPAYQHPPAQGGGVPGAGMIAAGAPGYGQPPTMQAPPQQPRPAYPPQQAYPQQPAYQQPAPVAAPPPPPPAAPMQTGDPLVAEADGHFKAGSYHNAISTYRDAIARSPNSVEAHFKLGIAYAVTKRFDGAVAEWRRVLELDPGNTNARDNIAKAEAKMRADAAVAQPVPPPAQPQPYPVQAAPMPPPAPAPNINELFQHAMMANSKGDYQGAVHYSGEVIRMKQDFAPAYVVRGDALLGLGQMDQAIQSYNNAMVFDPQLSAPLFGLAEAYRLLANKDKSLHYYQLFLRSTGPDKEKWRMDRASKMIQVMGGTP